MRFSYALESGGFVAILAAKSRLLKTVLLQSLHIRTSILTSPTAFSVVSLVARDVSLLRFKGDVLTYLLQHLIRLRWSNLYEDHHKPRGHRVYNGASGTSNSRIPAGKKDSAKR